MGDKWNVTGQRQTTMMQAGQLVQAMEVSFTTTSGVNGSVVIPLSSYSTDSVREAVDTRTAAIDAVGQL